MYQVIRNTKLETYLTLSPKPLFMLKFSKEKEVDDKENLDSQLHNMSSMQLLIIGNQTLYVKT